MSEYLGKGLVPTGSKQMLPVTTDVATPCKIAVSFVFCHPSIHGPLIIRNPLNAVGEYAIGQGYWIPAMGNEAVSSLWSPEF